MCCIGIISQQGQKVVCYGNPCIRVSEKKNLVLFLGFLRQFLQTEFQPRVDLKTYLNRWTTQTCYFNYSDSGRNLLKAAEQNTECIYTRFMHKGVFSCDNYVWNILGVRRFYLCDLFMQHSRKINSKTLSRTEVYSLKNKGKVILK